MTEAEWIACWDPARMLEFLRDKVSVRKLRLFAVGCCRRLATELPDQRSWDAVHVAEWFADGNGTEQDLQAAHWEAQASFQQHGNAFAAVQATALQAWDAAEGVVRAVAELWLQGDDDFRERSGQCDLLRDIFGPLLFRSVPCDAFVLGWNSGQVVKLAQAAYENQLLPEGFLDPDRFAILADALEDAGCMDAEILAHCRKAGEHVRGCWLLDLLLGRT